MIVTIYSTDINLLAVLLGTVLAMIIGATWYSPVLFAKPWMKEVGKTMEELQNAPKTGYLIAAGGYLLLSLTLAYLIGATNAYTLIGALRIALAAWGGFIFTSTFINTSFSGRTWKLALIDSGYFLLSSLVIATVIHYL